MSEQFINIELSDENLDIFVIRRAIFKSIQFNTENFYGRLLDIGCGQMPYKDYILKNSNIKKYVGLDIETARNYNNTIKPDETWDGVTMPFASESFDTAIGTEVLEHCPEPEIILKEVARILKKNGLFFFTVPFLWNLHEVPNDQYRYTPFSLERHLRNAGFKNIKIKATGGWHASMAQMLGLWVKRSHIPANKRKILFSVLKPIIKYLVKIDKSEQVQFKEGSMITGLYGIAKK